MATPDDIAARFAQQPNQQPQPESPDSGGIAARFAQPNGGSPDTGSPDAGGIAARFAPQSPQAPQAPAAPQGVLANVTIGALKGAARPPQTLASKFINFALGLDPGATQEAEDVYNQPGIENKIIGGIETGLTAVPFVGGPTTRAMLAAGRHQIGQSALQTGNALLQGALFYVPESGLIEHWIGGEAAHYLPGLGQALREAGVAKLAAPAASEATEAATHAAAPAAGEAAQAFDQNAANALNMMKANIDAFRKIADPARIQTPEDVDKVIDEAADFLQHNDAFRTGQRVTLEQQAQMARATGMTLDDLLKAGGTDAFNAEQNIAARDLLARTKDSVLNAARLAASGDENWQQNFLESLSKYQVTKDAVRAKASEAGRALGSFRVQADAMSDIVDRLSKLPDAAKVEAAQKLAQIDPANTEAIAKFTDGLTRAAAEATPASWSNKLHEIWINSLLSGGSTQILKTASDLGMLLMKPVEDLTAAGLDAVKSTLTGSDREYFANAAKADIFGMVHGLPDAFEKFAGTLRNELDSTEFGERQLAVKGFAGRLVRLPTTILAAITDAAKALNSGAQLSMDAYRIASKEGLAGDALSRRVAELLSKPTQEMLDNAAKTADERTFQQPLEGWARNLTKVSHAKGWRWVLPFAKTPYNILKAAVERSPVGLVRTGIQWATHEPGVDVVQQFSKNLVGSAVWLWAIHQGLNGNISGAGPDDFRQRAALEAQGWQPYSIRVGDHWINYDRFEPVGFILGNAASLAEGWNWNPNDASLTAKFASGFDHAAEAATQLPFLFNVSQLARDIHNKGAFGAVAHYGERLASSFVPSGVAHVAWMIDPTVREPQTLGQEIESRVPGMTKSVPALESPSGPIVRPRSELGGINPYPVTKSGPGLNDTEQTIDEKQRAKRQQQIERQRQREGIAVLRQWGWERSKDVPLREGHTRFLASDGSVHDVPTQNMHIARERDPNLVLIAQG